MNYFTDFREKACFILTSSHTQPDRPTAWCLAFLLQRPDCLSSTYTLTTCRLSVGFSFSFKMQIATDSVQQLQRFSLETFLKSFLFFCFFSPLNSNNLKLWFWERTKLDVGDVFSLPFSDGRGGSVVHANPAPWPWSCHLWGQNHYFSKGAAGLSVWCGPGVLYATMRENVEGKVECVCVCEHMSVFACAAVHVTWQGDSSQRAAGTDVWLPLTAHSRGSWSAEGPTPGPPFPRDKS